MSRPIRLWDHHDVSSTQVDIFRRLVNSKYGLQIGSYHDLWEWSVNEINQFWLLVWEYTKVKASVHPALAISSDDAKTMFPVPQWFAGGRLNFAENIIESSFAPKDQNAPVITSVREGNCDVEHITLSGLRARVGRLSNALKRAGIQPGDRVACICSNSAATAIVFLASATVGAIFTCCSPESGTKAILDRFLQTRPRILFADDYAVYNGKSIPCLEKIQQVSTKLVKEADLETVVIIPRLGDSGQSQGTASHSLDSFIEGAESEISYAQLPFSHPLVIVYSSGTTGEPKCIVHSIGGVLMKQKTEQILGLDMGPQSTLFQYSSTNWIMYLYSVSGLLSGARSVLYDGSPMFPRAESLLDILSQQKVTHFGTSAHYLSLLQATGLDNSRIMGLPSLVCITSTGSVLTEPQYHWVIRTFGAIQLSSIAGGTDIAGAFVGGSPNLPVYAGWCQARALGMKVQIFSDDGVSIESSGEAGELVCTVPFPSQPLYFWEDRNHAKYNAAYFSKFPGIWCQGDFIRMDPETKGIQFLGRSDGVLNPSGVRFGSAEIYNALEGIQNLEDCLCIGRRRLEDSDEAVLLFVKTKRGALDGSLITKIKQRIARDLSKRHLPKYIIETPEIPMTINGKKAEVPVKRIMSGQSVATSSTIVNPNALDWFRELSKLPMETWSQARLSKL